MRRTDKALRFVTAGLGMVLGCGLALADMRKRMAPEAYAALVAGLTAGKDCHAAI